jgi:phosphoglycolate phosphatase
MTRRDGRPTIVLFDIDGTLIRSAGIGRSSLERALEIERGWSAALEGVILDGRTDPLIVSDAFAAHGEALSRGTFERVAARYTQCLEAAFTSFDEGRVLPGVFELLDLLDREPRLAVGLVTGNIEAAAKLKLEHFGLGERFTFGAYGSDGAERAALVELACQRSGLCGREPWVLVIGDTPSDVAAAKACGASSVAVATGHLYGAAELAASEPSCLLDDLSDPRPILELLELSLTAPRSNPL